jgi:hypothetical protein
MSNKVHKENTTLPATASDSSSSESLYVKLAKSQAASAYALVNKRYLGNAEPIFVDHNRG